MKTIMITNKEARNIMISALKAHGGAAVIGKLKKWVKNNYPGFNMSNNDSEWYRCRWALQELKTDNFELLVYSSTTQSDGKWRIAEVAERWCRLGFFKRRTVS